MKDREIITLENALSKLDYWRREAQEGDRDLAEALGIALRELRDRIEVIEGVTRKGGIAIPAVPAQIDNLDFGPCPDCGSDPFEKHSKPCEIVGLKIQFDLDEKEARNLYNKRAYKAARSEEAKHRLDELGKNRVADRAPE